MEWQETHHRLLESLRGEVRGRWGGISEIEARLGLSDGYLNRLCSGKVEFKLETFLRTVEVLGLDHKAFLARALDIHPDPDRYLAQLARPEQEDRPFERIVRATLELECSDPPSNGGAADRGAAAVTALVADIAARNRSEQLRRLRRTRKYRTHAFARAYLEHLDALRYDDAVGAAKLVTGVAVNLIPALPGPQHRRLRLQCQALGIFGSARRSKGELGTAARSFRLALEVARRAGLHAATGELLQRASYLLKDSGHFAQALALLNEALVIFVRLDSRHDVGRVLVDQGMILAALGNYETAVMDLEQALHYLEGTASTMPRSHLAAYQILAYAHEKLDDLTAAERCLADGVSAFGSGHAVDRAKLQWSQGTIAFRRGDFARSEAFLRAAGEVLGVKENPGQQALVAVDLVGALLAQSKSSEAIQLAKSMAPLLMKFKNNRFAEAGVLELVSSSLEGRLNLEVVGEVRAKLEQGCTRRPGATQPA